MPPNQTSETLRSSRSLACELCKQRKVKCDRQQPCTNCLKAGAICVPCSPAPTRQRRQRPNQVLQERLARCEKLIEQFAAGSVLTSSSQSAQVPGFQQQQGSHSQSDGNNLGRVTETKAPCRIIEADGDHRYIDTRLWARVHDEIQNIQLLVAEADDFDDEADSDPNSDDSVDFLFTDNVSMDTFSDLDLQPLQIYTLWQVFLDRVDPLYKVLHTPSLQSIVVKATCGIANLPFDTQAILYSMFALTVVSLTETECSDILSLPPANAIRRLKTSASLALKRSKFIMRPNMKVLQALVLYPLISHQLWDREKAWTLGGLTLRLALRLGYHRDGELLGICPFETELRRRIWWQIVRSEGRFSAMLGQRKPLLPSDWDTKMPKNVNDRDIFPGQREPVTDRNGPTEMAFVILLSEVYRQNALSEVMPVLDVIIPVADSCSAGSKRESVPSEAARAIAYSQTVNLDNSLRNLEDKIVDVTAGAIHGAALAVRQLATDGKKELLLPLEEQPEWGKDIRNAEDLLFKGIVVVFERTVTGHELMQTSGFGWWMRLLYHPEALTAFVSLLCRRPIGSFADRAWDVLGKIYDFCPQLHDLDLKTNALQAKLIIQAWKARVWSSGTISLTPVFIEQLESALSSSTASPIFSPLVHQFIGNSSTRHSNNQFSAEIVNLGHNSGVQDSLWDELFATGSSNAMQSSAAAAPGLYDSDMLPSPYLEFL